MNYTERIWIDPERCAGKPCIKGTRIPVIHILELVARGIGFNEIIEKYYPNIKLEDIKACVEFSKAIVEGEEVIFFGETVSR